jgi:hypothetical protein
MDYGEYFSTSIRVTPLSVMLLEYLSTNQNFKISRRDFSYEGNVRGAKINGGTEQSVEM